MPASMVPMTKCAIQPANVLPPMIEPSIWPMFIGGKPIKGAMSISAVMTEVPTTPASTTLGTFILTIVLPSRGAADTRALRELSPCYARDVTPESRESCIWSLPRPCCSRHRPPAAWVTSGFSGAEWEPTRGVTKRPLARLDDCKEARDVPSSPDLLYDLLPVLRRRQGVARPTTDPIRGHRRHGRRGSACAARSLDGRPAHCPADLPRRRAHRRLPGAPRARSPRSAGVDDGTCCVRRARRVLAQAEKPRFRRGRLRWNDVATKKRWAPRHALAWRRRPPCAVTSTRRFGCAQPLRRA